MKFLHVTRKGRDRRRERRVFCVDLVWVENIRREELDCPVPALGACAVSTLCPQDPGTTVCESGGGGSRWTAKDPTGGRVY